jgi:DNA-binding NtrC family response regulator
MKPELSALLLHDREDRFGRIRHVLEAFSAKISRPRSCREAESHLSQIHPPQVVLTDVVLSDGNCMDVLELAAGAREWVNVIVVSPIADINLYLDVMNRGAFDFVTDSFSVPELVYVVRSALDNTQLRRQRQVRLPPRQPLKESHVLP